MAHFLLLCLSVNMKNSRDGGLGKTSSLFLYYIIFYITQIFYYDKMYSNPIIQLALHTKFIFAA